MKTYFISTLLLLLGLLTFSACEKTFFEPEPASDPVAVFENLWSAFKEDYGPFEERGIDWDATYAQFRPQISEGTTEEALYGVLTQMLATLDDGHVNLSIPGRPVFRSNTWFRERTDDSLFNLNVVKQFYLAPGFESGEEESYVQGLIGNDVAYVWFDYVGDNWAALKEVLEKHPDKKGLIVDLRHNQGGDFTYAFANMGRLTNEKRLIFTSKTKNGPGPNDFTDWHSWHLEPQGTFWDKKIVVLTDRYTISAGERAVMAFRALPQVTIVGDTTNGATSTMIGRELANGWNYSIATQKVKLFDNQSYEGIGIAPDIRVINSLNELANGKDAALEKALEVLE